MARKEHIAEGAKDRLARLREGLLALHRVLVGSERALYERDVERIRSSYQMLALLMNDPWFEWLHDLSRLVVEIDEVLDEREAPVTSLDADRFTSRAAALIVADEFGQGFQRRYFEALQRDPDVILAHGRFRKLLQAA